MSGADHGVHELRAVLREQGHERVSTGRAYVRAGVLGRGRVRVRVKGYGLGLGLRCRRRWG